MNRVSIFVSVLLLCVSTASFAQEAIFLNIGLNKDVFYPPDEFEIWVSAANGGPDILVDVYLSIGTPDGRELYAPAFNEMAHPWMANVVLPQGFDLDWTPIYSYALPSMAFPLATPGQYMGSLWLCAAGTDDRLTLASFQQFTIAPCQRRSWLNDNMIWSLKLDETGLWAGLEVGLKHLSYDSSAESLWHAEDGVTTLRTRPFDSFEGGLALGGSGVGVTLKTDYGWETVLNTPGSPLQMKGIRSIVRDPDGSLWFLHDWVSIWSINQKRLSRVYPTLCFEDHTQEVPGEIAGLCQTGQRETCAITTDGLYVFNGTSFDFYEIPQFATTTSIKVTACHGDMFGNIWISAFYAAQLGPAQYPVEFFILRYDLNAQESTKYGTGYPGLPYPSAEDITSDPEGNVWLATSGGLSRYDGTAFTAFPCESFTPNSIAADFDGIIYCGTYGDGIFMLKEENWLNVSSTIPEIRSDAYTFALGLPEGRCMLTRDGTMMLPGYEVLDDSDGRFRTENPDTNIPWPLGVCEGQVGRWLYGMTSVYLRTAGEWIHTFEAPPAGSTGPVRCMEENDDGEPFLLTSKMLFEYEDGAWATVADTPEPDGPYGYGGFLMGHNKTMHLNDIGCGVKVRHPDGTWSRIDTSRQLPGIPDVYGLSEDGVLYALGQTEEQAKFLMLFESDGSSTTYWLDELGLSIGPPINTSVAFDLADRAWLLLKSTDGLGLVIIFDPATETFTDIPWSSGMLPSSRNGNVGLMRTADRSFPEFGVLWWPSYCVWRLNLAPRTEMLLDKEAYPLGETMQVDAYFANQAGSIPVDWYAAAEDEHGNLFYWPTYTQAKTPALAGLLVPTDTALILHLDDITIPDDVPPGHYKWKTGFTRAGQDTWLGLGFTASAKFDVLAN